VYDSQATMKYDRHNNRDSNQTVLDDKDQQVLTWGSEVCYL